MRAERKLIRELEQGTCFILDGRLVMRMDLKTDGGPVCVDLGSGATGTVDPNRKVSVVPDKFKARVMDFVYAVLREP